MAKAKKIENNGNKEKLLASADEALLSEFFSIIANIAIRLTRDSSRHNNTGKLPDKEGEKQ
jgi:hypothetical protein